MDSDSLHQPVFSAADWLARQQQRGLLRAPAPRAAALLLQPSVFDYAARRPNRRVAGFAADVRLLKQTRGQAAVVGDFGLGAPATGALADQLLAWGVRALALVGLAGGLQLDLSPGAVVICERALRGEGVSAHYLPPAEWIDADAGLTQMLASHLRQRGLSPRLGASWTTDAPFRELRSSVLARQRAGVLTVEMEVAALLSVARAHNAPAVAVLVVADSLAGGQWRWSDDDRTVQRSLRASCDAALEALAA